MLKTIESKMFVTGILTSLAVVLLHFGVHVDPVAILGMIAPFAAAAGWAGWSSVSTAKNDAQLKVAEVAAGQTHAQMARKQGGFITPGVVAWLAGFAAAFVAIVIVAGCVHGVAAAVEANAGCKALGTAVKADGTTLAVDLFGLATGNPVGLEAELVRLLPIVGLDGIECAYAAVKAMVAPSSGSAESTAEPLPGMTRIETFIVAQKARK